MSLSNDTKGNEVRGYWNHDAYTQNKVWDWSNVILGAAAVTALLMAPRHHWCGFNETKGTQSAYFRPDRWDANGIKKKKAHPVDFFF